jgi:hypothetical protein
MIVARAQARDTEPGLQAFSGARFIAPLEPEEQRSARARRGPLQAGHQDRLGALQLALALEKLNDYCGAVDMNREAIAAADSDDTVRAYATHKHRGGAATPGRFTGRHAPPGRPRGHSTRRGREGDSG